MDWDETDANTGLSMGCKAACEIIDGLDHHELHLFNAPRRDNPAITAGELIERYLSLKSRKGACNDAKTKANDDDSDRLEDEGGEVFTAGVEVRKRKCIFRQWLMRMRDKRVSMRRLRLGGTYLSKINVRTERERNLRSSGSKRD